MEDFEKAKFLMNLMKDRELDFFSEGLIKDFFIIKVLNIIDKNDMNEAEKYSNLFEKSNLTKEWEQFFFTLYKLLEVKFIYFNLEPKSYFNWKNNFDNLLRGKNV